MTSQKLFTILKFLDELDGRLKIQLHLEGTKTALDGLVTQPANPPYQAALASVLSAFKEAAGGLRREVTPSHLVALETMNGAQLFDPWMAGSIETSIQTNATTPSVARDFVEDFRQ
jgi:hypothetical protein